MRLEGWRTYLRNQRLRKERLFLIQERKLEKLQNTENNVKTSPLPKITGTNAFSLFHVVGEWIRVANFTLRISDLKNHDKNYLRNFNTLIIAN